MASTYNPIPRELLDSLERLHDLLYKVEAGENGNTNNIEDILLEIKNCNETYDSNILNLFYKILELSILIRQIKIIIRSIIDPQRRGILKLYYINNKFSLSNKENKCKTKILRIKTEDQRGVVQQSRRGTYYIPVHLEDYQLVLAKLANRTYTYNISEVGINSQYNVTITKQNNNIKVTCTCKERNIEYEVEYEYNIIIRI